MECVINNPNIHQQQTRSIECPKKAANMVLESTIFMVSLTINQTIFTILVTLLGRGSKKEKTSTKVHGAAKA